MKTIYIITSLIFLGTFQANAQFTINDVFSDPAETTNMTQDIFVVWWDNDENYASEVIFLLQDMIQYKEEILSNYSLQVPQSTIDGFYINIYLHADGGFFDSNGWGNGVGTDTNGYPFMTLPFWIVGDKINTAHETFHIFQHNLNSSGFWYEGDKNWYTEASANWFAYQQNPNDPRSFVTSEILARLPHEPLWSGWFNRPDSDPDNWQRENHQYALGQFLFYLSEVANISNNTLTEGFFANTAELPQEYLFNNIGGDAFRQHFIDWAGLVVNDFDFDFMSQVQKNTSFQEWNTFADLDDDNEYNETFGNSGTNGWYSPESAVVTNAWAFNTYKLENTTNTSYTFEIDGDEEGIFGSEAYFQGKVLVKDTSGNSTFYDLEMTDDTTGSVTIDVTTVDAEIYFIVASMPEYFEEISSNFQKFPYQMKIKNNTLGVSDNEIDGLLIYPNPVSDYMNISASEEINSVIILNMLGQEIISINGDTQDLSLNLSPLSSGNYFAKIQTNSGFQVVKLVKK